MSGEAPNLPLFHQASAPSPWATLTAIKHIHRSRWRRFVFPLAFLCLILWAWPRQYWVSPSGFRNLVDPGLTGVWRSFGTCSPTQRGLSMTGPKYPATQSPISTPLGYLKMTLPHVNGMAGMSGLVPLKLLTLLSFPSRSTSLVGGSRLLSLPRSC